MNIKIIFALIAMVFFLVGSITYAHQQDTLLAIIMYLAADIPGVYVVKSIINGEL